MPEESVVIIEATQTHNPEKSVVVHFGTFQCMRTIKDMTNPNITSQFLIIRNVVKETPWKCGIISTPAFNKILAGVKFKYHLHDVVCVPCHTVAEWGNVLQSQCQSQQC